MGQTTKMQSMKTSFTRTEIFDLLWEIPTTKVAKQLGVSDVALTKWCAKHDIPKPPLGYWAKIEHGKKVPPKPSLTPWKAGRNEPTYSIHDSNQKHRPTPVSIELKPNLNDALATQAQMSGKDAALGPCAGRTAKALERKPDSDGFLYGKPSTFHVRISATSKERVIHLLNTIELSLTAAGMKWEQSEKHKSIVGSFLGETVSFSIVEAFSRTEHIEKHPTHDWLDKRSYTYQFLGDLKISIDGYFDGRKSWSDGKTTRLEEKLPEIIAGFLAAAEAMRRKTMEREAQRIRWEEEAAIRREHARIESERQHFLEIALKEAHAWSDATLLRQYAAHLRNAVSSNNSTLTECGEKWLCRAEEIAEWLDPTSGWCKKGQDPN